MRKMILATILAGFGVGQTSAGDIQVHSSKRYYTLNTKPIFILGHYDWASIDRNSFIDQPSTYRKMIDDAATYNLNYIRIVISANRFSKYTTPKVFGGGAGSRTPFAIENEKIDLDTLDSYFWSELKSLLSYAKDKGVIVHVTFFDGVQIRSGNQAYRWGNSIWNIDRQVENFYGDLDADSDGTVDDGSEFYKTNGFLYANKNGSNDQRFGYYQKMVIDKTLSITEPNSATGYKGFDNVFYETGNELLYSNAKWQETVINYVKSKSKKAITVNPRVPTQNPTNSNGLAIHTNTANALELKSYLETNVGKNFPFWLDPDGGKLGQISQLDHANENRKAAWYSLTSGAAGYGGFTDSYWLNQNQGVIQILKYFKILMNFIAEKNVKFYEMKPARSLISNPAKNAILANQGKEYLAYVLSDSVVKIDLASGLYDYSVFDPKTGKIFENGKEEGGGIVSFSRGSQFSGDWVVYLKLSSSVSSSAESNLASNKTIFTSSIEGSGFSGKYAVDGRTGTRWASKYMDGQWLEVDLGQKSLINKVNIRWEKAYASEYKILGSNDRKNWTTLKSEKVPLNSGTPVISSSFPEQSFRYVRVLGVKRATRYGISIYEVEVY